MTQSILCFNTPGSTISDAEIIRQVHAIQTHLLRDFAPVWSLEAPILRFGKHSSLQPGEWALGWFRDATEKGALGFHELTPEGYPLGEVLVVTTRQAGASVPGTACHEADEMTVDPFLNRSVTIQFRGKPCYFPCEPDDPPEADRFGYEVAGELMSDFTTPEYWHQAPKGPYTFRKSIKKPLPALAPGGYLAFSGPDGNYHQITARGYTAHRGRRGERRKLPRELWKCSAPTASPPTGAVRGAEARG